MFVLGSAVKDSVWSTTVPFASENEFPDGGYLTR